MRAMVIYESMYGNTHLVADRIAEGLRAVYDVEVVPVAEALTAPTAAVDLLVVGAPTHIHSLPSARSRDGAREAAAKAESGLTLEPAATGVGLREWFEKAPSVHSAEAAAFDTRIDGPAPLTGRASKGIAKRLRRHGYRLVAEPESFLVDKHSRLLTGEAERAEAWGERLAMAKTPAG